MIVDDLIAYRIEAGRYLLIVNASNRDTDFQWLKEREIPGSDVRDISDDYASSQFRGRVDRAPRPRRGAGVHVLDG